MKVPEIPDLADLEARFQAAFRSTNRNGLQVIGYGEITSVVSWSVAGTKAAVKRLPPFASDAARDTYLVLLRDYLDRLEEAEIAVLPTGAQELRNAEGSPVVYLVQPELPAAKVGPALLAGPDALDPVLVFGEICAGAARAADRRIGFDAQLSNWVRLSDGELGYVDVTTPLLRDGAGHHRLDTSVFVASLPWLLRPAVRRFVAPGIMDEYFELRIVLLNMVANLHKERLEHLIPAAREAANRHLDSPITREEIDRYYRKDARLWEVLQRLRRADRAWQLKVRRRPYPVLLPDKVER